MTLIEQILFGSSPWLNFIIGIFDVLFAVFFAIDLYYIILKWNIKSPKVNAAIHGAISILFSVVSILSALLNFSIWYNALFDML